MFGCLCAPVFPFYIIFLFLPRCLIPCLFTQLSKLFLEDEQIRFLRNGKEKIKNLISYLYSILCTSLKILSTLYSNITTFSFLLDFSITLVTLWSISLLGGFVSVIIPIDHVNYMRLDSLKIINYYTLVTLPTISKLKTKPVSADIISQEISLKIYVCLLIN